MKKIHLICNAHLDPVWQWEWEEGAAAAISTFRCAADFCEQFGDFVFCHNEALLYEWVEEYEPTLFSRIVKLVKDGKWHIMGGWQLQPDCNMLAGEAFIRQALVGRKYFDEKFGVRPITAINFDPFGHTRGLVQIMAKCGYKNYLFTRPSKAACPLPAEQFKWIGFDGSEINCCRCAEGYNSGMGKSVDKIKSIVNRCKDDNIDICLWGVGDHGGGASRKDLEMISELQKELKKDNIEITHSTPDEYFAELEKIGKLPTVSTDINPFSPGCYTSQIRIKQKYRLLENTLFQTEKMCSAAALAGLMEYPKNELHEAEHDMLTVQFHDSLPGSSIQPVEEMAIRICDHALEILSRVRARAFFALSAGQRTAEADEIPILVFNPNPYEVEGTFECEFMLWDQNWNIEFSNPEIYKDGKKLPAQPEKENSSIPIDWRKRVVFHAVLPAMQMSRFDCKLPKIPVKPTPVMPKTAAYYLFDNGTMQAKISRKTGLLDSLVIDGKEYLKKGGLKLQVIQDNVDPWGMNDVSWTNKLGEFTLLSPEEGTKFSNVPKVIPSVRVIEDGAVRTVVETVLGYNTARAVVRYMLNKNTNKVDIELRVIWDEKAKMIKMALTTGFKKPVFETETAFGRQIYDNSVPNERCSQRFALLSEDNCSLALVNTGVYGISCDNNVINQTILRSASYTAHPLEDRIILPPDRFMPYMEQGERLYKFSIFAGKTENVEKNITRYAAFINQYPMTLSFFPQGGGKIPAPQLKLSGDSEIEMTAFKKADVGNGFIARIYNSANEKKKATLSCPALDISVKRTLKPYEVVTLRLEKGKVTECDMTEKNI